MAPLQEQLFQLQAIFLPDLQSCTTGILPPSGNHSLQSLPYQFFEVASFFSPIVKLSASPTEQESAFLNS